MQDLELYFIRECATYFKILFYLNEFTSLGPSLLKFSFLIGTLKIYNQCVCSLYLFSFRYVK